MELCPINQNNTTNNVSFRTLMTTFCYLLCVGIPDIGDRFSQRAQKDLKFYLSGAMKKVMGSLLSHAPFYRVILRVHSPHTQKSESLAHTHTGENCESKKQQAFLSVHVPSPAIILKKNHPLEKSEKSGRRIKRE